jgi:hypothetical protein
MKEPAKSVREAAKLRRAKAPPPAAPLWTDGIRSLYDSVAQEPLPADFQKLLEELFRKSIN